MNSGNAKVITFISGKGGSGKTSVAIAIARLLADIGFPTLLIDFDLATNGASYFFQNYFAGHSVGIWEVLTNDLVPSGQPIPRLLEPIIISDRFGFIPSRVRLYGQGKSYDAIPYTSKYLRQLLEGLIATNEFMYILIDCQAGYSISTVSATECSNQVVIVTEPDSISNDAAENLMIQLAPYLPKQRKYLVNKIDVRDAETYRKMQNVFQSINRLPPLPFDFGVRSAFGARKIPINIKEPSPLLFALLETLLSLFPEITDQIRDFKNIHVDSLFAEYNDQLQRLLDKKSQLESKQVGLKTFDFRFKARNLNLIMTSLSIFLTLLTTTYFLKALNLSSRFLERVLGVMPAFAIALVSMLSIVLVVAWRRHFEGKVFQEQEMNRINSELATINRDLDRYRSLLLTRSNDFLIDAEIASSRTDSSPRDSKL